VHIAEVQSILVILSQHIAMILLLVPHLPLPIGQTILHLLEFALAGYRLPVFQLPLGNKTVLFDCVAILLQIYFEQIVANAPIEVCPQFGKDLVEAMILFLHLLVVTPALLCLASSYEIGHTFEDLVCPA